VLVSSEILTFDDFCLDRRGGGLFRRDQSSNFVPVPIGSRALDILSVLTARPGELVSKDEIVAAVWPGMVVEDSNLTVQISALRRVLDRGRADGSLIQTVAGRGYRFVDTVGRPGPQPASGTVAVFAAGPVPPRLSIVVLPFANVSNDLEQQYFADGITDDLTADLSRLSNMFVISQYRVHISKQVSRHEANRPRVERALCARRKRPAIGQPGADQCPADRCGDRRAFVGGAHRSRHG
jgi:DNA-binding winged helix-turn-helix (wHTH) protein